MQLHFILLQLSMAANAAADLAALCTITPPTAMVGVRRREAAFQLPKLVWRPTACCEYDLSCTVICDVSGTVM